MLRLKKKLKTNSGIMEFFPYYVGALEGKHSETVSTSVEWVTILQLPEKVFCCCSRIAR
jgi:hypothetical protein